MRRSRFLSMACGLAFAILAANAGHTAGNVSITLRTATPTYYTMKSQCTLSVPDGSDGIVALEAAKANGCIQSYKVTAYSFGTFVDCIDNICNDPAPTYLRYWAMRVDTQTAGGTTICEPTSYGVSDYRARNGSELSFTFETFASGSAAVVC